MKKRILYTLPFLVVLLVAAGSFSNIFRLGDGADTDKKIYFDKGDGASNPWVGYDSGDQVLGFSNDGVTFEEFSVLNNPMTTLGDIIIGGALGVETRLGLGADNYILRSDGTTIAWEEGLATSSVAGLVTSVSGSAIPALAHGTWTPTVSFPPGSNMDSVTALSGIYQMVGNTVTGSMYGVLNSTAGGPAQFRLTLPIASNFTDATNDAQGIVVSYSSGGPDTAGGVVQADTGTDQFIVTYYANNTGGYPSTFTFSYLVK